MEQNVIIEHLNKFVWTIKMKNTNKNFIKMFVTHVTTKYISNDQVIQEK